MASTSAAQTPSKMEGSRNWVEMPHDLMDNILGRLDAVEILNSAMEVCTTWWRICKDPAKWKVIDFHKADGAWDDLVRLTKKAVYLSRGQLIDISISWFATNDLLHHIALRSSKLNSLCLTDCYNITGTGLTQALKRVPQLEKLNLTYSNSRVDNIYDLIPYCPQLKSFRLDKVSIREGFKDDRDALAIARNMPELRHLELYGNSIKNSGLQAILNGCPHLEFLDVRTCAFLCFQPGNDTGTQCMEQIKRLKGFKGPDASTEDCGFHPRDYHHNEDDYDIDAYHDSCWDDYPSFAEQWAKWSGAFGGDII